MIRPGRAPVAPRTNLRVGLDFRAPEHRREVFLRFFEFHVKHRAHPGAVYYLMPWLRDRLGWTDAETLWFAFINGNTQNPVTSLIIHRRYPGPEHADEMLRWFDSVRPTLAFDTDRRHHKTKLGDAVAGYLTLTRDGGGQADYWRRARDGGWPSMWAAARAIPTFGRLSAFSYAEYLHLLGFGLDTDTLFLDDRDGSRSHRNGLALVLGRDDLDWHASNPSFDGVYPPDVIDWLTEEGATLLAEAQARMPGRADVSYFTMESALCTFKSWHRPNRRYPNVYNDLLYDRIRVGQKAWPDESFDLLWEARWDSLPKRLLLEEMPHDPGCVPAKQNLYREHGWVVMMDDEWSCFRNPFNRAIDQGLLPKRPA